MAGVLELEDTLNPFHHKSWFSHTDGIVKGFITKFPIAIRSWHSHYVNLIKYISSASDYFSSKMRRGERCRRQGYSHIQTCFFFFYFPGIAGGVPMKSLKQLIADSLHPILLCRHPAWHKENMSWAKVSRKLVQSVGSQWVYSSNLLYLN